MVRNVAAAGLWCSIHPYLNFALAPEIFTAAAGPGLRDILRMADAAAALTGHDVPLVLHGGHANCGHHDTPPEAARACARSFFCWLDAETRAAFPRVRVVCETAMPWPPKDAPRLRLGDTYAECLSLVEGTALGICWDMGHSYQSVQYGRNPALPPPEFLRRVTHVHAHDVTPTDGGWADHRALGSVIAPWRDYLRVLGAAGFAGSILFELDITSFGGFDGAVAMVRRAVSESRAALGEKDQEIVEFSDAQVYPDAKVQIALLCLSKGRSGSPTRYVRLRGADAVDRVLRRLHSLRQEEHTAAGICSFPLDPLGGDPWLCGNAEREACFVKIERAGVRLERLPVEVCSGVSTGADKVFLLQAVREGPDGSVLPRARAR